MDHRALEVRRNILAHAVVVLDNAARRGQL